MPLYHFPLARSLGSPWHREPYASLLPLFSSPLPLRAHSMRRQLPLVDWPVSSLIRARVVPNALVEVIDNTKGTSQSTRTDREGVYRFFFLAPSTYTLTVTREGFQKESRTVNVLLGPPGTVNFTLEIARTSSEVTVTDEAPLPS